MKIDNRGVFGGGGWGLNHLNETVVYQYYDKIKGKINAGSCRGVNRDTKRIYVD